ncbi:MAG: TrkH family potassium uptake protein [Spirochaetales bacterium]|nr:TrkH family potassium uptake protein [Spirochaetales bacterium]
MGFQNPFRVSERFILFAYFLGVIALGSGLLALPVSWSGQNGHLRAPFIDAFFTAVSATCVTGLATVDTTLWSRFGQWVILGLIQAGGLGIVTFAMLYFVLPRARMSLKGRKLLQDSFQAEGAPRARSMVRSILIITFTVEFLGAILLAIAFWQAGTSHPIFEGLFHAVSAFCNAGFSVFDGGMEAFRGNVMVNVTLMFLIIVGGIGFTVIRDIRRKLFDWRRPLLFHTRVTLLATPLFILIGWLGYLFLDQNGLFSSLPQDERLLATLFQSITTRTAGFNTVDQASLSLTSRWLTLVLMLIGGGSGSTAGGIKVTTAFILFFVLFRGVNERGDIRVMKRRIPPEDVGRAAIFFLKAAALLFLSILLLALIESPSRTGFTPAQLIFECISALGTVGLSMGITGALSLPGKLIIIVTMFAGRVGLFSMVIRTIRDRTENLIEYPKGEVLIG